MIAKLWGRLDAVGEDWAVVDVHGVGYLLYCSARTLRALPPVDTTLALCVETHVREDHIHLYGFVDEAERDWFRLLQTVQGVGARVALAILSVVGPEDITRVIAAQDKTALSRANGVGGKLAGRILSELKELAGDVALGPAAAGGGSAPAALDGTAGEAVSALVNLGYRRGEALTAVSAATRELGGDAALETLIRAGLRELGR